MLRFLVADGEISVWFNPMSYYIGGGAALTMLRFLIADEDSVCFNLVFPEAFENETFLMPGELSAPIKAVLPRITYRDAEFAFEAVA